IRDFHVTGVQTCALPISTVVGSSVHLTLIQSIVSPDFLFMYLMFFANELFGLVAVSRLADMTKDLFKQTADEASTVVAINGVFRSEERRVGKGCGARWWP